MLLNLAVGTIDGPQPFSHEVELVMVYFTSDLHFYHDNIITHVNRPFRDSAEMNRKLVERWNERVTGQDDVYILGDVTMKGPELAEEMISQLKGRKYLIRGNHDRFVDRTEFNSSLFVWVRDYAEITVENTRFVLFHYPIEEWNGYYKGSIHLHGHQHNHEDYNFHMAKKGIRRYDVGVDANYMAPVSAEDILTFFEMEW